VPTNATEPTALGADTRAGAVRSGRVLATRVVFLVAGVLAIRVFTVFL
jgi:hypothetical protein